MVSLCAGCNTSSTEKKTVYKIGVTLYDPYDVFLGELMDEFRADVALDPASVKLEVVSASGSQRTQNKQVEDLIADGCDVICVNLVDRTAPSKIIDLAKEADVPIIFFNRELVEEDLYRWEKLYYVGADAEQSGEMEGEIAAEYITGHPEADTNGDGLIQYYILEGEAGHQDAVVRTEQCVSAMNEAGMSLEKKGYAIANWKLSEARTKITQYINENGNDLELILANNDAMALGAIEAYTDLGLEMPVIVGIDGTNDGLTAVKERQMAGTVYNDKKGQADAMYQLASALATGGSLNDLELTDGKYYRTPYEKITLDNVKEYMEE